VKGTLYWIGYQYQHLSAQLYQYQNISAKYYISLYYSEYIVYFANE